MTHYRAATAAPRAHAREAKGADAPARRLRAALMSHHKGPMVSFERHDTVVHCGIDIKLSKKCHKFFLD